MRQEIVLGNRYAGFIENKTFVTRRNASEHLFKLWQGLGFNQGLIDRFVFTSLVKKIKVLYDDNGKEKVLITTPLHLSLNAIEWSNSKDIQDKQYILFLTEFEEQEQTLPTLPLLQGVQNE